MPCWCYAYSAALAPEVDSEVTRLLQNNKFSLIIDESNDRGQNKQLVLLASVYDPDREQVSSKFIDMPVCNIGTGANIFDTIDKVFR
jgi:hypothetical protein